MPDIDGTLLAGPEEAREEAVRLSGSLLKEIGKDFWKGETWFMEVEDEADGLLFTLTFSAQVGPASIQAAIIPQTAGIAHT